MLNKDYKLGSSWKLILVFPLVFIAFFVVSCTDKDAGPLATEAEVDENEMIIANSSSSAEIDGQIFYVVEEMRYMKFGKGWGQGDPVHACDSGTGNCTDFHSYFIALARTVDIPARFAIGASIPSARNEGRISGYHCWAEFYAEGKGWQVDISEGDKY